MNYYSNFRKKVSTNAWFGNPKGTLVIVMVTYNIKTICFTDSVVDALVLKEN